MTDSSQQLMQPPKGFHVMAKPIGPACNLNCHYCFYSEKTALFEDNNNYRMSDEVLKSFIRKHIEAQDLPEIPFAWQGGEPTLMGIDFFRKVVELQKQYANGKRISNSFQTNGMLINEQWCRFFVKNKFLIGLSMDGPKTVHDRYRVDHSGKPTFTAVHHALKLLIKHGVEFNILACVNRESSEKPLEVYRFFRNEGVRFIQFIPIVERLPDSYAQNLGLHLSMPPALTADISDSSSPSITPWTVKPKAFGDFLIAIFDEWVRNDVGKVFVMNFEWAVAAWMGIDTHACAFSTRCGDCVVMEHNGDIYACDHFVYPKYKLGNIVTDDLTEMVRSERQIAFGALKEAALPQQCRNCSVLFACRGECPKHRFATTAAGEPGLNYLCTGYREYFTHIHPYMKVIRQLLENGLPADYVMKAINGPLVVELNEVE